MKSENLMQIIIYIIGVFICFLMMPYYSKISNGFLMFLCIFGIINLFNLLGRWYALKVAYEKDKPKKKRKKKYKNKIWALIISCFVFIIIALTLLGFIIGYMGVMLFSFVNLNHQEYKYCKLVEEICNEDFNCNYFGKKEYDIYCGIDFNLYYHWQNYDNNITKNKFDVCRKPGDIIYESSSSSKGIELVSCKSGQEYNMVISNYDYAPYNGTILIEGEMNYFQNLETNKIYLINNGSFNIFIAPLEVIYLNYHPDGWKLQSGGRIKIINHVPEWFNESISKLIKEYFNHTVCVDYYGFDYLKENPPIKTICDFTRVWNAPCLFYKNNNVFVQECCNISCVENCGIDNDSCLSKCIQEDIIFYEVKEDDDDDSIEINFYASV